MISYPQRSYIERLGLDSKSTEVVATPEKGKGGQHTDQVMLWQDIAKS